MGGAWRPWSSRGVFLGCILAGLAFLLVAVRLLTGTKPPPSLPAVVADYGDHFAIDAVLGMEGGLGTTGWRGAACLPHLGTPPFPVRLPKFAPSATNKNIFFLETTCATAINAKMACAVESAAVYHPHQHVHLALTSTHVGGTDGIMQALTHYTNIRVSSLDLDSWLRDTGGQLAMWLRDMKWAKGTDWASINLSDALRLAVVCSVGGTYLDLDMWTVANLPPSDVWIGRERWDHLSNGAFRITKDHWLCVNASRELTEHYIGNVWGHNGPGVFQRVVRQHCNASDITNLHQCRDLVIVDPATFYPLHWKRWEELFVGGGGAGWTWARETVGLHLWNKFSSGSPLIPGDGSVVDRTAKKHCPKVYATVRQMRRLKDVLQSKRGKARRSAGA